MSEPLNPSPPAPPGGAAPPPPPPGGAPPPPPPGGVGASPNRGLMVVLSYLWIFALIPYLVEKDDPEVQWHAKNGLVLTGAELVTWLVLLFVQVLATWIFDPLGCLVTLFGLLLWLAVVGLRIFCIVKGVGGERFEIPYLSPLVERF